MSILKLFMSCVTLFSACHLSALSIGRNGASYPINDVLWQPVKYVDTEAGFKALLPGSPSSGMDGSDVYTYSKFNQGYYEVCTNYKSSYTPPHTAQAFLDTIMAHNSNALECTLIPSSQDKVLYIVQALFSDGTVARFYCSHNKIYQAIFEGSDPSLAQTFFDSIKITH